VQDGQRLVAPVEALGQGERPGLIQQPQLEAGDAVALGPGHGLLQIGQHGLGALVAALGDLGQQLEGDGRQHAGQGGVGAVGRHRGLSQLGVHRRHRVGRREGRAAGEHLVEGGAQRVQIGALIDQPVHAPGLLGGHVRQRAGQVGRHADPFQEGGGAEVDQGQPIARADHHVGGVHIPVQDPALVHPDQRLGQLHGQGQEDVRGQGPAAQPLLEVQRAGVGQHQRGAIAPGGQPQRAGGAPAVQAHQQLVLALEGRGGGGGRGVAGRDGLPDHRVSVDPRSPEHHMPRTPVCFGQVLST
jgi:hypothetical protein